MPAVASVSVNKKPSLQSAAGAATNATSTASTNTNTNKEGGFKFLRRDEGRLSYSVPNLPETPSKSYNGMSPRTNASSTDKLAAECGTPPSSLAAGAAAAANTKSKNNNTSENNNNNVNNSGDARGNRERRASRSLREIIAEDMRNAKNHDYLDEVVVAVPKKAPPPPSATDKKTNNITSSTNNNKMKNETDESTRKEGSALRTGQATANNIPTSQSSSSLPPSPASRANPNTRQTRQGNTRSNHLMNKNDSNIKSTSNTNTAAAARRNSISRRPVWVDPEIPNKHDNENDNNNDDDNNNNNMLNQRSSYRDNEFDTVHSNTNNNNMGNHDVYHKNTNVPSDYNNNNNNMNALYGTDVYDMNDTIDNSPFARHAMPSHVHPSLHPPRRTMSAPRRFTDFNAFDPQHSNTTTTTTTNNNNIHSAYSPAAAAAAAAATSPSLMPMAGTNYFNRPRPRDFSVPAGRSRVLSQPTHPADFTNLTRTNVHAAAIDGEEAELMLQLEREVRAAQHEREQYMNLLEELNSEKSRFEAYKFEMQQQWDEEHAAWEQTRQLGEHAAQKEVKVMNERYRSVSSLLSNERSTNARLMHENESLRSQLEELTSTLRESQMMHKTEVARLRRDIDSLTRRNTELFNMTKEQQLRLLENSDTNRNPSLTHRSNSRSDNMNSVSINNNSSNSNANSYSRSINNNNENNESSGSKPRVEVNVTDEMEYTEATLDSIPSVNVNNTHTDKNTITGNMRNRVTSQTSELVSSTMMPENKTRNERRSASTIPASAASRHHENDNNTNLLTSTRGRLSESQPSLHSAAIRAHSTSRVFSNRPTNTSTSALPGSAIINASDTNNKVNTVASNMAASIPVLNLPTTTINNNNNNNKINNMDHKGKEESITTENERINNEINHILKNSAEKKKVINLSPMHASQVESAELDVVDPTSVVLDFTPRKNDEAQRERKAREMAAHLQREEEERQQRRLLRERQAQERKEEQSQLQLNNNNNYSSATKGKLEEREKSNSQESTSHVSRLTKSKTSTTAAVAAAVNVDKSNSTATKTTSPTQKSALQTSKSNNNNNSNNSTKPVSSSNTNSSLVIPRNPKLGQTGSSVLQSQTKHEKSTSTAQGNDLLHKADIDNKLSGSSSGSSKVDSKNGKATCVEKETTYSNNSNANHINSKTTGANKNNNINKKSDDAAKHTKHEIEKIDNNNKDEVEEENKAALHNFNENSDNDSDIDDQSHDSDDNEEEEEVDDDDNTTNKEDNLNATQRPPRVPRVQRIPTCAELIGEVEPQPQENVANDSVISQNTLGNNANKREELYNSGKRVVYYSNGTIKTILPSGHTILRFVNKDVKTTFPSGTSTYWYEAAQTTHTQKVNGVQIFQFHATGQTERHLPNGTKEILYPDGSFKIVYADGTDETLVPDSDEEMSSSAPSQE